MSSMEFEQGGPVGPPAPLEEAIPQDGGQELARFEIHVPLKDASRKDIPHVLAQLRQALTQAGFPGRTILPQTQGDWGGGPTSFDTDEQAIVLVDTPDTPENLEAIKGAAQAVKDLSGQQQVYITVSPLRSYLV
jgi:hypothetical protein